MTLAFWREMGRGTLILEYPVVSGERDSQRRAIDALIVLDGEFIQCPWADAPDLAGRPVMVVQTKPYRTDAVLVGQAVFSPILLRRGRPAIGPIQSVLLSPESQPAFDDLLQRNGVREVTVRGSVGKITQARYPPVAELHLDHLHERLGGEILVGVQLRAGPTERPVLKVDAVILPDRPRKRTRSDVDRWSHELIPGARAFAVVSTRKPLGMGVAGRALVAQHLLRAAGAREPQAIALVGVDDRALQYALGKFKGLTAELVAVAI